MSPPSKILYFDNAATTQITPEVLNKMIQQLESGELFANPSSISHHSGQIAAAVIDEIRTQVASEFGCEFDEVIFTSGATEANNLALQGIALAHVDQGRHIVTSTIEHKSVLDCCAALQAKSYKITYLNPNGEGWVEPEAVAKALRPDTLLISLQHTNNETGVIQPIAEIAELAAETGLLLHVDAAQAAGKFYIDLQKIPIDLLTLSAHKFHGPKGVGCLIVRDRRHLRLQPLMHGGGQEFGLRPGTLATHQIVGLGAALHLASVQREANLCHVRLLKHRFLEQLSAHLPVQVNGELSRSSPYIVNFSIEGISSDALINQLREILAISSGSACSSGSVEPSYVLRTMGIEGDRLYGAVRLSFSSRHTVTEVDHAVEQIIAAVQRMRELN